LHDYLLICLSVQKVIRIKSLETEAVRETVFGKNFTHSDFEFRLTASCLCGYLDGLVAVL